MKAAQINEYGDVSVIHIVDINKPIAGPDQVLVEVHAASINPFDTTIRSGKMKDVIPLTLPVTLGGDIAGVVAEVGENVTSFVVGDKVYGQANVVAGNSGAFAEFAVTAAGQLGSMPVTVDYKKAAALPLVGVSALQVISEHLNLQAGQKLFIHGGAGGIGSLAIQIAKHVGAYVATTATGEGIDFVKKLGADEVIDYTQAKFYEILHNFDAVFDTVGGDDFNRSLDILNRGGKAVSMIAEADQEKAARLGVTAVMQHTKVNTEVLTKLSKLVNEGVVTPQVDKVYQFDDIIEAFEARESGKVRGKVVLEIKP